MSSLSRRKSFWSPRAVTAGHCRWSRGLDIPSKSLSPPCLHSTSRILASKAWPAFRWRMSGWKWIRSSSAVRCWSRTGGWADRSFCASRPGAHAHYMQKNTRPGWLWTGWAIAPSSGPWMCCRGTKSGRKMPAGKSTPNRPFRRCRPGCGGRLFILWGRKTGRMSPKRSCEGWQASWRQVSSSSRARARSRKNLSPAAV